MRKPKILNNKGFSLPEVIAAAAILGILAYGIIEIKASVFKMSQGVIQRSSVARIIYAIQEDLVKDIDNLPLRANPTFITGATFNQAQYEASFDDNNAIEGCYDKEGRAIAVTSASTCTFRLRYYRIQEVDRNYVASGKYEPIPLSRLVMRIKFTDSASKSERTLYLSRLKTHVLKF